VAGRARVPMWQRGRNWRATAKLFFSTRGDTRAGLRIMPTFLESRRPDLNPGGGFLLRQGSRRRPRTRLGKAST
jgi:hypothetical protein